MDRERGGEAEQGIDGEEEALLLVRARGHDGEPEEGRAGEEQRLALGAQGPVRPREGGEGGGQEESEGEGDVEVEQKVFEVERPGLHPVEGVVGPLGPPADVVEENAVGRVGVGV